MCDFRMSFLSSFFHVFLPRSKDTNGVTVKTSISPVSTCFHVYSPGFPQLQFVTPQHVGPGAGMSLWSETSVKMGLLGGSVASKKASSSTGRSWDTWGCSWGEKSVWVYRYTRRPYVYIYIYIYLYVYTYIYIYILTRKYLCGILHP